MVYDDAPVTRPLLPVALALVCGPGCGLFGRAAPPPPARGVVLVLADGFGDGETEKTPALGRLAAAGRSFEAAFAPDPEPGAARAAVVGNGERSIAALFRARGAAVGGVGHSLPLDGGAFDLRLAGSSGDAVTAGRLETWLRQQSGPFLLIAAVGGEPGPLPGQPQPATTAGSFAPPLPRIAVGDLAFSDRPGGETRPPAWSEPARQRAEAEHLERSLAADAEIGSLLALVERAAPGAAVVVVGDPSPDRGGHGLLTRPDALFDDTLRSTLVVAAPGLSRPGRPSRRLVSTLDVAPTLLALAGLAPGPTTLVGGSLMPLLADPGAAGRAEALSSVARKAGRVGRTARTARWRYTEWPDGSRELYDHDADPGEFVNVANRPEQAATIAVLGRAFATARPVPAPRAAPTAPRRNVLLILVDDLNVRVGAWGAPVATPAIDRLAARGVRFDRAYVQVAMCSPSRVSMLTGWRPERTGVWMNLDPARPEGAAPIQEHFAAHGAVTVAVGKVLHYPESFRWDLCEEHPEVVEEDAEERVAEATGQGLWAAAPGTDLDQPDGRRARRAASLLERYRQRPFFLVVGLVRPHLRWIAPARYFGLYPPEAIAPVPFPSDDLADVPAIAVKTKPQPLPGLPLLGREPAGLVPDPDFRRRAIAAYQACVSFADAQVGVLLDAMDRLGLWKDTVVVLAGDNGFHLGDHGGLFRKDTLFEEALHVPLVVAAPGLAHAGAVVRAPVELLDVYPTVVELAGLPAVPGLDGRSLGPLLADPGGPGRGPAVSYRRVQPPERAWSLRTETVRYTLWPDGSEELYDLRSKAAEAENVAARPERAAEKARLRARLEALVAGRRAPAEP